MNLRSKLRLFFSCLLFAVIFGCTQHPQDKTAQLAPKYSLYILAKDGSNYLIETSSLATGTLSPENDGVAIDADQISRADLVKDGYYYDLDERTGQFAKYTINNKKLKQIAAITLKNFSIENFEWFGSDTLLLTGLNHIKDSEVVYNLITTTNMKVVKAGKMDIPKPQGIFNNISVGVVERRNNQLFVGYTYHQLLSPSSYHTSDTVYLSTLKYPEMKAEKLTKDTRSTYPGGINTIQPYSFNDEQGNYYVMTCPGIALGNRPELPTALMRIQRGEQQIDQNYFFDLSGSIIQNHAYGIWYVGHNYAIVRSERKDLYKDLNDHYETAHFSYYLIDVLNRKVIERLKLPLDRGTRKNCIIVEGDVVYIAINSKTEGNYIWQYHLKTKVLQKGLQLNGSTDYILRID
ncbi:DUF4374 domain-containing protein [Pedobacter sp. Hv1]|uniref:DUF4374 domain-containing protein n=1 Tax=Pedobacter sp. Hv1 TaxID=1740090 RepID=UPI0006D89DE7|nr:DUF4374 domain-containing protein [Pedobacter sp. Hv1]KQC02445.1 hypothetical protein AQF98_02375 [Pedobacter sp. Hv1]